MVGLPQVNLVDVYGAPEAPKLLYRLMEERTPEVDISHQELPDWESHLAFVASHPYDAWYLIEAEDALVGAIYLSKMSEIGAFVFAAHRGHGYGKRAIEQLMKKHPREHFLANINPANANSIEFFRSLGFHHIQNTYEKR
jgi:RimJ/RimL family protein N-acetyltransferase